MPMAKTIQDKWRNEFEGHGQASWYWQQHARSLLCAANVLRERARLLEERPDTAPDRVVDPLRLMPVYVLYGYALENLIKGLLVARGETATWYGTLDKDIRHHDLQEFFRRGDVKLDKQEKAFLADMRDAIESGKYPVGVKPQNRKRALGLDVDGDFGTIFSLFRRVEESLQKIEFATPIDHPATAGLPWATGTR
jgi:hypothetical protein